MLREDNNRSRNVRPDALKWIALSVKPRHENVATRGLETKGLETFLPLMQRRHQDANRTRQLDVPLFPGYLFCRFNDMRRVTVFKHAGSASGDRYRHSADIAARRRDYIASNRNPGASPAVGSSVPRVLSGIPL